jgi:hypothetical protein
VARSCEQALNAHTAMGCDARMSQAGILARSYTYTVHLTRARSEPPGARDGLSHRTLKAATQTGRSEREGGEFPEENAEVSVGESQITTSS